MDLPPVPRRSRGNRSRRPGGAVAWARHRRGTPRRFPVADVRTGAGPAAHRGGRRPRVRVAARAAGGRPADRRQRNGVFGASAPISAAPGRRTRTGICSAMSTIWERPQRDKPQFAQLCDGGTAEFPHRPLRRRRAAVSAAREIGRAVIDRQADDRAQCSWQSAAPICSSACTSRFRWTGAARCRRARARSMKRRCSIPNAGLRRPLVASSHLARRQRFPQARRLTPEDFEVLAHARLQLAGDPELRLDMSFMPGDIQFLHNHTILHARSPYEDWPEPGRKPTGRGCGRRRRTCGSLPPVFAQCYGQHRRSATAAASSDKEPRPARAARSG